MSTITFHPQIPSTTLFVREIRNPLCIITLACDLLTDPGSDEDRQKYLDLIKKATSRINQQVTALVTDKITIN